MIYEFMGINYGWVLLLASLAGMAWGLIIMLNKARFSSGFLGLIGALISVSCIPACIEKINNPEEAFAVITTWRGALFIVLILLLIGSLLKEREEEKEEDYA